MPTKYRVPVLEKFEFQPSIKDKDLYAPPGSPAKGDRYRVKPTGTGAWAGHDDKIAWYDGASWQFDIPKEGFLVWVDDENLFYTYDGSSWALLTTAVDWSAITNKPSSTVADIDSAVSLKHSNSLDHSHANKTTLDAIEQAFTSALKTAYDGAVTNSHAHSNKSTLDSIEQALTTALKGNYDTAYSSRAVYDAELGCLTFEV